MGTKRAGAIVGMAVLLSGGALPSAASGVAGAAGAQGATTVAVSEPSPDVSPMAKATPELSGSVSGDTSYLGLSSVTFGIRVKVGPRVAAGHVEFREGEDRIGRVRLRDGIALYTLPKDLPRGTHSVTLAFEPSAATAEDVDSGEWDYTIKVKKPSAKQTKTLKSKYCRALQDLSAAKVGLIRGGARPDRAEYRAYTKAAKNDSNAKGSRIWKFLRDSGPGLRLGKVDSSASVYLGYRDIKPSAAQKYQTRAMTRCVG